MRRNQKSIGKKAHRPKMKLGLPDLDQAKAAVLSSLRSPESQRGYRHSVDEFVAWYCSEPRLSFNKTVVTRYRIHLETRQLVPGTVNVRLAAVRRLAWEGWSYSDRSGSGPRKANPGRLARGGGNRDRKSLSVRLQSWKNVGRWHDRESRVACRQRARCQAQPRETRPARSPAALAPACVTWQVVRWSRFNSYWAMSQCRQQKSTLEASSACAAQ